jgi:Holliday junction DNA helicase RuvB
VVNHLDKLIAGAKALGSPCPSLLLSAPSGFGKTAIAEAISREYGSTLHSLFAGPEAKAYELAYQMLDLKFGDILFIDEAHSLPRASQELLFLAIDKRMVPTPREEKLSRSHFSSIADTTLILASNRQSGIATALRNRLITIEFDAYNIDELKAIAEHEAVQYGRDITPQAARRLAEVAQGTPRGVNQLIQMLRLYFPEVSRYSQEHVQQYLTSQGIDRHGLRPHQRAYLVTLAESKDGSCTLTRSAAKLGLESVIIRDQIEPYLLDRDLIDVASTRGRTITMKGRELVGELNTAADQGV